MAFTPAGMFYLSNEDLAPSMDMMGGGIRGMLGVQNEEEAIMSLAKNYDVTDLNQREDFFAAVRQINPRMEVQLRKEAQEWDKGQKDLIPTPVNIPDWKSKLNAWNNMSVKEREQAIASGVFKPPAQKQLTSLTEKINYFNKWTEGGKELTTTQLSLLGIAPADAPVFKQRIKELENELSSKKITQKVFDEKKLELIMGGGKETTVNVSAGDKTFESEYGKSAGKGFFEQDDAMVSGANRASEVIEKAKLILTLIDGEQGGQAITGLFAEWRTGVARFNALLMEKYGSKESIAKISDTEILNAATGSDVFPLIKQLGIGARGLDTVAERKFMREVMTGTNDMNPETLRRMALQRIESGKKAINKYNNAIDKGHLDPYFEKRGYRLDKIKSFEYSNEDIALVNKYLKKL